MKTNGPACTAWLKRGEPGASAVLITCRMRRVSQAQRRLGWRNGGGSGDRARGRAPARRTRCSSAASTRRSSSRRCGSGASTTHTSSSVSARQPIACERMSMTLRQYETIRANGTRFAVVPGHADPRSSKWSRRAPGHQVVEKDGLAGIIAEHGDPRSADTPSDFERGGVMDLVELKKARSMLVLLLATLSADVAGSRGGRERARHRFDRGLVGHDHALGSGARAAEDQDRRRLRGPPRRARAARTRRRRTATRRARRARRSR